jgi:hypothetical protein
MEELPAAQPELTPVPVRPDATSAELVVRLEAIKERIFRLRALFAVSLAHDCAIQAQHPEAHAQIVAGHEALLLSPPIQIRQTIPLDTQRLCELRWEVSQAPIRRIPKRPAENIPDGLS